jgi:hypothetical protein
MKKQLSMRFIGALPRAIKRIINRRPGAHVLGGRAISLRLVFALSLGGAMVLGNSLYAASESVLTCSDPTKNDAVKKAYFAFLKNKGDSIKNLSAKGKVQEFLKDLCSSQKPYSEKALSQKILYYIYGYGAFFGLRFETNPSRATSDIYSDVVDSMADGLAENPFLFLDISRRADSQNRMERAVSTSLVSSIRKSVVESDLVRQAADALPKAAPLGKEDPDFVWYEVLIGKKGPNQHPFGKGTPNGQIWTWKTSDVEKHHNFIQIIFPSALESQSVAGAPYYAYKKSLISPMHYDATPLTEDQLIALQQRPPKPYRAEPLTIPQRIVARQMRRVAILNADCFLNFMKMHYNEETNRFEIFDIDNFKIKIRSHNNRRMSRMARALTSLGLYDLTRSIIDDCFERNKELIEKDTLQQLRNSGGMICG